ncbi:MAG: hypothetical protein IPG32_01635 [Saprospirales bacterium]|nr:hypothetical protein [Saprospirales bacterium]
MTKSEDAGAEDDGQGPLGDEEYEIDGEEFFAISLEPPLKIRYELYHYHF